MIAKTTASTRLHHLNVTIGDNARTSSHFHASVSPSSDAVPLFHSSQCGSQWMFAPAFLGTRSACAQRKPGICFSARGSFRMHRREGYLHARGVDAPFLRNRRGYQDNGSILCRTVRARALLNDGPLSNGKLQEVAAYINQSDHLFVPLGIAIMLLYNLWHMYRIREHPLTTVVGVNHASRKAWVEFIMQDHDKRAILAVQTLRNWMTAGLQLASTAMVISSGIAGYVSSTHLPNDPKLLLQNWWCDPRVKLVTVVVLLLIAFLSLVLSIRSLNHVGFLVAVPPQCELGSRRRGGGKTITPNYVSQVLALGSDFYSFGIRCYFFTFPFLMWFFGAFPMLVGSLATVALWTHVDRAHVFDSELGPDGVVL